MAEHNGRVSVASDWMEANLLFDIDCDIISRSDAVDALVDSGLYDDQAFADEFLVKVWGELTVRARRLGRCAPFEVSGLALKRKQTWKQAPAHAYCLALSMIHYYRKFEGPFGTTYSEQGELFEKVAESSLITMGWRVVRTGWASGQSNVKFPEVVDKVATHLNEKYVNRNIVDLYKEKNEHGLDLVVSRPFLEDERGGRPAFLVQCASGRNEVKKRKTPDLSDWCKMITFESRPGRAFVVPFSYEEDEFSKMCFEVEGIVLDRYRLLSAGRIKQNWLSVPLKRRILEVLDSRNSDLVSLRA